MFQLPYGHNRSSKPVPPVLKRYRAEEQPPGARIRLF
jgi:hypothetical protein